MSAAETEASTGPTILIAEDHADSREALRTLLEATGYRVFTAEDGAEAVEQALAVHPDLIIMDIMMPRLDGLDATRQIRSRSEFDRVPILALSALGTAGERAVSAGCDDYLTKPIEVPTLFRKVHSWVNTGRAEHRG